MNIKKMCMILLGIIGCLDNVSTAEEITPYRPVHIEGVLDSDTYNGAEEAYVYIRTSKFGFSRIELARTVHNVYKEKLVDGRFSICMPSPAAVFYLHILYRTPDEISNGTEWIDRIFVMEEGDSLLVRMSKDNMDFSGRGAERMNCQMEIFRNCYKATEADLEIFRKGNYTRYIEDYESKMETAIAAQIGIVQKYRDRIKPEIAALLEVNCHALRYSSVRQMNFYLNGNGYQDYNLALKKYYGSKRMDPLPLFRGKAAEQAPMLANYLLEMDIFNANIKRDSIIGTAPDAFVEYIYNRINRCYTGGLRNKMLVLLFLRYNQNSYLAKYFNDVYQQIPAEYQEALNLRKTKLTRDSPFFPFGLVDANGDLQTLSGFSDKVVVVDFWYTGCPACLQLAAAMKLVKRHFRDVGKLVFLTISIDRSKATWLRSLKEEKYTDGDAVNLYTGGAGKDHPLIKYYSITSYPTLFVIKNGRMFDAFPPRPVWKRKGAGMDEQVDASGLIALLEKALSQP